MKSIVPTLYEDEVWRVQVRVAPEIVLSDEERAELTRLVRSKRTSVRLAQRARMVLLAADTHKHPNVQKWLAKHPRFTMHFTPTSASWLNMVERFFRDITTERLRRGVFTSVPELIAAIRHPAEGDPRQSALKFQTEWNTTLGVCRALAVEAKIRLREDRFLAIRRPIVVLRGKKRRKYGPHSRICSPAGQSPTGS
ncbi:integrase catalytic subunit [Pseudoxanthomonas spadix BD-a59]|uniref:Integrase catalytic subunit n=1 Tax=Pseudoxanthomonas spadix (strain BD-a59) TaxID=1045855 RepID=G7URL6_PSEUP|nr:integrase catalytic subunit [Pseudoxanthomonas spadix BD-a59]